MKKLHARSLNPSALARPVVNVAFLLALAGGVGAPAAHAGITFTNDYRFVEPGDLNPNGFPLAPANTRKNFIQASKNWENCFTTPNFNIDVTVYFIPRNLIPAIPQQEMDLCGAARITQTQVIGGKLYPKAGDVFLNSNAPWWVDATPNDHVEFSAVPNQPWHGIGIPGVGPMQGNQQLGIMGEIDMLSCIKHELGHVLGFFPNIPNGFWPNMDNAIDVNGDISMNIGGNNVKVRAGGPHWAPNVNVDDPGLPMGVTISNNDLAMAPLLEFGERKVQSAYDIGGVGSILGLVPDNLYPKTLVPAPSALGGLMLLGGLMGSRRRRGG